MSEEASDRGSNYGSLVSNVGSVSLLVGVYPNVESPGHGLTRIEVMMKPFTIAVLQQHPNDVTRDFANASS
jgi:hypothetical protein